MRQRQQVYESLDVDRLAALLEAGGWRVRRCSFEQAANAEVDLSGCRVHYTGTQDPGYRPFVDAVLSFLAPVCRLIPRYEIFRCHEDKVYQELLIRREGFAAPAGRVFGNLLGLADRAAALPYPAVLKTAAGYQSRGVSLVRDADDLRRRVRRANRPAGSAVFHLKHLLKRTLLRGRYRPEQYRDCRHAGPYLVQDLIGGAAGDWKVLVYGSRLFVLRRGVRPGDFRASGSGRFSWQTPPDAVLDFAADVQRRLDLPMVSLDIIESPDGCRLIEFQGLHFGTYTLDESPHCFRRRDGAWVREDGRADLEAETARALLEWLERDGGAATP